ncbi:far upstream element-binding protein 3 isoform X2 [Spodoptera frugiperda]|uniref:Far upstream element-binding protein 3 isoform X2 n=1 Tax=Spodoptera frugiperda TaxID=7108 RepID=A0A9R0DG25_SPOFR|nr:far upstream element-binding protein 3 isoform X2 [Spodoptera frugiperda]
MSDYSSMATLQNNSHTAGFAAAVQRARLVAAKLEGGGSKRPLEEGPEPNAKKVASVEVPYQPPQMSAPSAAPAASRAAPAAAAAPPPPPSAAGNLMPDQTLNEYIRVPDKMVGLIIGRGGEQITRLQAESGCKIQMAPDSGGQPDRLCTLTGSREAIQRAKELVNQIVNHRGRENAPQHPENQGGGGGMPPMQRGAGGGGGGGAMTGNVPIGRADWVQNCDDEIMLPGPKVGLIIGKNGKTIKQLQEQSGAKMVVIQDGPNTEYEKPLRISGDPAKVEHAKQLVYELLADKDMQQGGGGPRPPQYDDQYQGHDQGNGLATNSTEVLVPKIAVGIVIGRGGDMIKKIQAETGCRVQFHQERDDGPGDKRCYLQGKPHQVDQARQMIEDLISSVNRREQEVRSGRGRGGSGQRNGDRAGGDYAQWQDGQEIRVTFTVSNVKCGLIIGRGGEVIKQINAASGAHCELDRRAQGSDRNNRTFYIRGHPEAVEHCKRIIMEKVGMPVNFINEGNGGNGGGNGNGNGNGGNGGEYYGGGAAGPPAWGYNPHWHQPQQQQNPQVQINPATGQPDYSQQWIDYYRSLGLVHEAEAIEQQAKQQKQGGGGMDGSGGGGTPPASAAGGSVAAAGPGSAPAAPASGAQPDYSAQWAEYYRSIGKLKEAEAIEAQIKLKSSGGGSSAGSAGSSGGGGASGGAGAAGQYAQYGVYAPQVYPAAYQPYPYAAQPAPDHHQ